MNMFYFLAPVLGVGMRWLYQLLNSYGWTIILFTVLVRIIMFPLSLKQQKSTARMSAYQPMIQEIQKKWANDKQRQQQEMQKFYEENNVKMSFGCLPMAINMIVLFGIIGVIQAPLTYMLKIDNVQIQSGVAIVQEHVPDSKISVDTYTQQAVLIGHVKNNPEWFTAGAEITTTNKDGSQTTGFYSMDADVVEKIDNFDFQFMGLNMAAAPTTKDFLTLIMPILSLLTMAGSQIIMMFSTSGAGQNRSQMIIMTVVMGVMFGFFAFRVPVGFSLYYTISNIVMALQQMLLRKIFDPNKIREEIEQDIAERRAAKKAKKKVVYQDESGETVSAAMTDAEIAKMRLAKAREIDAKRYAEDPEPDADAVKALEEARRQDEEWEKQGKRTKQQDKKEEPVKEEAGDENKTEAAALGVDDEKQDGGK